MTSHAALVARGWGKCCIVGCGDIEIHAENKTFHAKNGVIIKKATGSLERTWGLVYRRQHAAGEILISTKPIYKDLMKLVDKIKQIGVRANAETPEDAVHAVEVRRRRHRAVPYRTYVLRRRKCPLPVTQDDRPSKTEKEEGKR